MYGSYLAMVIPIYAAHVLYQTTNFDKQSKMIAALNWVGLALLLTVLFLNQTRAVIPFVMIALLLVFRKKTSSFLGRWIPSIMMLTLISMISLSLFRIEYLGDTMVERFVSLFDPNGDGWTRVDKWLHAIEIFVDNPFTGIGLDEFSQQAIRAGSYGNAENTYLTILCETGLLGAIPFCLMIVKILQNSYSAITSRYNSYQGFIGQGIHVGIIGLLVHGLADPTIMSCHQSFAYFAILLALSDRLSFSSCQRKSPATINLQSLRQIRDVANSRCSAGTVIPGEQVHA